MVLGLLQDKADRPPPLSEPRGVSFEVQYLKDDHWITEQICRKEEDARALAARILPNRTGVRIIREFVRPGRGGETVDTIIHTEYRQEPKRPIAPVPVEEAHYCKMPQEYLAFDSRVLISRVLRQYLDEKGVTASELLHNAGEAKRVLNFEALVPNAVSRIATLQSKETGEDSRARRDVILGVLEELRQRAEKAVANRALPYPKEIGFAATMRQVDEILGTATAASPDAAAEEAAYLGKVIVCRDLVNIRGLLGKAELLIDLASDDSLPADDAALLDQLLADVLVAPDMVRDMLGRQPDLMTALNRMIDLIGGTFEPQGVEMSPPCTAAISRWAAGPHGNETRAVLLDFLRRQVRGTQRLSHGEPLHQIAKYRNLVNRLMRPDGLLGGPAMAEAVLMGYHRFIEQGGAEGRRLALESVLQLLPTGAERLVYLACLARSDVGAKDGAAIAAQALEIANRVGGLNDLVDRTLPLKPKMEASAALYRLVTEGDALPGDMGEKLGARLDDLVATYIVDGRVIERLDDPSASLRVRATRLVQFAGAEVLASPKARRIVRDQIISHLRQPNFDTKFVEGLTTEAEKAAVLRNFYDLLNRAQFM
ncbi:hypothetical protein [Nitrospirillum amazonense]|uniref:Uncharacterized protein n=1 Tax=Nitrospirillum amazonense TaxID=28077 RepID=A0A560J300_9PROT|nr:hypothetical protein [Nitrospirillum amazonense]MDG3441115.1 hypothetical protein [Nitrospirillum amazonense]TWB65628.1 hypothetical protein FBZ87_12025 [Nitrospirillum amazonense]